MRPSMIFRLVGGILLLNLALASQPALCQDSSKPDFTKTEDFHIFPPVASATAEQKHSAVGRFLDDVWKDQKAIWTSPARMTRRQFFTLALPLAAATAGLIATDEDTGKFLANTPGQIRWSKRFSYFGSGYTLGALAGAMLVGGKVIEKPHYSKIGRNAAEALANAEVTVFVLKKLTGRERPDHFDGQGRFWKGGESFPSGHAINSWAVAFAIARTRQCPRWLAITSYVMATGISLSRWTAHRHFISDVMVGGVLGGLIGNYVATRPR